jgi:hypothetical protein
MGLLAKNYNMTKQWVLAMTGQFKMQSTPKPSLKIGSVNKAIGIKLFCFQDRKLKFSGSA